MTLPSWLRLRSHRSLPLLIAALLVVTHGAALAQQPARSATLELGFGGAVVAEAWNPLRLVLRDVGPVQLELAIDRGTLREGERWTRYSTEIAGGSGLSVFEDEVFVPVWRSLSWVVRSGGLTVASGSIPRTQADRRPLDLVVGEPGSEIRSLLSGGRTIDLAPDRLPLRSAAFDGVGRLIVAEPSVRPQVLIAASVAGADVVVTPAAQAEPALAELLPSGVGVRGVGAGRLLTLSAFLNEPAHARTSVDQAALVSALAAAQRIELPRPVPMLPLLLGASAYSLTVLLMLRFGGVPGMVAALMLGVTLSVAIWVPLRPAEPSVDAVRELVVGAAGVGQRWRVHERLTLPAREVVFPVAAWPLGNIDARQGPDSIAVDLARWRNVRVLERPRAVSMALVQDGESWRNAGDRPLELVVVRGGSAVQNVPAGALLPAQTRDVLLPELAMSLLELVPSGAAVASDGQRWMIALPENTMAESAP